MAENKSDSDSEVDMDVNEPYPEGEETPDAFLVSLEALDENSWEFDLHLIGKVNVIKSNFKPLRIYHIRYKYTHISNSL